MFRIPSRVDRCIDYWKKKMEDGLEVESGFVVSKV